MADEPTYTAEEFLDWLCWSRAMDGERFYPPDETAAECIEHFEESDSEIVEVTERSRGREYGSHARAYMDAVDFFEDAENWGFDPKARAERYIEEAREDGSDLPEIDWAWWEDRQ